ncbi:acid protease [Rhodofomes roseus]|uniref:Acid protease n=1 Tax=Rhodofomes roseus TaxID=34475 RepID=A0ABQ8KHM8_9APHY|nr:acid protease [Rhodofomes roseus]KAH9837240.1 acid protease [Rhodofomes roseus]
MALGSSLLTTVLLALAVAASPVQVNKPLVSLPLVRRTNSTGLSNLLANDQARARNLKERAQAKLEGRAASVEATNVVDTYVVSVGVGSPATQYSLLVDTGSSNTWLGADKKYTKTSTSKDTGSQVSVTYGSGSFSGEEYTDTVTLGDGLTITGQSIGVASSAQGFSGVDGILGVGPVALTQGTLQSSDDTIPTVTDNLLSQGTISTEVLAVSFEPATSESDANGELTFGGTDSSKFTGSINYVPITSTSPASEYWGIDQSISYGSKSILSSTAGIVDTGTTLVLIASGKWLNTVNASGTTLTNMHRRRVQRVQVRCWWDRGPEHRSPSHLELAVQQPRYPQLQDRRRTSRPLSPFQRALISVRQTTYGLTANAQIWPRSLNSAIGGTADDIYLVVNSIGSASGEGLDFINGYAFLERFYSVYDTTNSQVGFAETQYTSATSN